MFLWNWLIIAWIILLWELSIYKLYSNEGFSKNGSNQSKVRLNDGIKSSIFSEELNDESIINLIRLSEW